MCHCGSGCLMKISYFKLKDKDRGSIRGEKLKPELIITIPEQYFVDWRNFRLLKDMNRNHSLDRRKPAPKNWRGQ